ncbi:MAG: nuclear transport factor 2 family protein [Actinomycetota bacterium]
MTASVVELADRAEILDVIHRYAWALDTRDWDSLDTCFTADAFLDYSSNPAGRAGAYPEIRAWLEKNLAAFVVMQHLMANTEITLDGDRAAARTMLVNPMGARTREGPPHFFAIGGRYDDDLVRTDAGWRITRRVETLLWFQGSLPSELLTE